MFSCLERCVLNNDRITTDSLRINNNGTADTTLQKLDAKAKNNQNYVLVL